MVEPKKAVRVVRARAVLFRIEIPDNAVWDFMKAYGQNFGLMDGREGFRHFKQVRSYYPLQVGGAEFEVEVLKGDEARFREFLENFSLEKELGPLCIA